ncbi:MAG TPA: hypothetical protein VIO94_16105 [Phenylobacterium sp.]
MNKGELISSLEKATEGSRELDAEIAVLLSGDPEAWVVNPAPHSIFSPVPGWWRTGDDVSHEAPAYTTSIDAIVALIERKLPGWGFDVTYRAAWGNSTACVIGPERSSPPHSAAGKTHALALATALLRALQHQGGGNHG